MPCRRPGGDRFLLLERAVALQGGPLGSSSGSKEVDALVAKLGEVLQLSAPAPPRLLPKHHGRDRAAPYASPRGLGFVAALPRHQQPQQPAPAHSRPSPSLLLLPPPPPSSAAPSLLPVADYQRKGSPRVAKQLCGRGWLRSAARSGSKKHSHPLLSAGDDEEEDDDPHRLLQQLILSGNLIKEAVRRLQLAAAAASAAGETSTTATTGSPGSASSPGSCCHSSGGEGDSAPSGAAAFTVSSLQPLP